MSRIDLIQPSEATGAAKQLLDAVQKKIGFVPNFTKALAPAPSVLKAYLDFGAALSSGSLSPKLTEKIALHVGEINTCGYCLSAHSAVGSKLGLNDEELGEARRGRAEDDKEAAALALAKQIVLERGQVRDEDLRAARDAGIDDGEIVEIYGTTLLNVFTNWFNHIADPAIDFPVVKPGIEMQQAS